MNSEGLICAVIVASGESTRFGYDKLFSIVNGHTVIEGAVRPFIESKEISRLVIVTDGRRSERMKELFGDDERISYVAGGETRTLSVISGLSLLDKRCEIVLIHDGARPFVTKELIKRVIEEAKLKGNAVPCVKATDTVYLNLNGGRPLPVERDNVALIQTPQAFEYRALMEAYQGNTDTLSDDSTVFSKSGRRVNLIEGDRDNIKITFFGDGNCVLTGNGADAHKLVEGRALILGGVNILFEKGLLGHSDADVLLHAVMDALLSAAGERDIGVQFPDTDKAYEGISSMTLLLKVKRILDRKGLTPLSVSAVIIAQRPRLSGYIPQMKENIAAILEVDSDKVNISATTTEGLGMIGEGQGIASTATCILGKKLKSNI